MQSKFVINLFLIFVLISQNTAHALTLKTDTSNISVRQPDLQKIIELKKDQDLNYALSPPANENFWNFIKNKISQFIDLVFYRNGTVAILRWLIIIGIITFIILKILKIKPQNLFYRNNQTNKIELIELNENIHNMNLNELIETEEALGKYKIAVRYMYLKTIKILNDNASIEWTLYKTNAEYITEIKNKSQKNTFIHLSYLFEFACYGDFFLTHEIYMKIKHEFLNFFNITTNNLHFFNANSTIKDKKTD